MQGLHVYMYKYIHMYIFICMHGASLTFSTLAPLLLLSAPRWLRAVSCFEAFGTSAIVGALGRREGSLCFEFREPIKRPLRGGLRL